MRSIYQSGEQVGHGFYLGLNHLEQLTIGREGGQLPGGTGGTWLRIPWLAVLAIAPVVGFLFVIFMPGIGIALVLKVVAEAALRETWKTVRHYVPEPAPRDLLGHADQAPATGPRPTSDEPAGPRAPDGK